MPDALAQALATDGLLWLLTMSFVAGLVRGFTGFGSGLVLLPATVAVLGPVAGITAMTVADLVGPMPILHRAARKAHLPDLARLLIATTLLLPVGLSLLLLLDPVVFRYGLSALALIMLGCLMSGLRYRGALTPPLVWTTGASAGLLGGAAGLPGPPIILLYLASTLPAETVRATILLYLFAYDLILLGVYGISGNLVAAALVIGAVLALPSIAGNLLGAALFRPGFERLYRAAAYIIIAASALSALPLWG